MPHGCAASLLSENGSLMSVMSQHVWTHVPVGVAGSPAGSKALSGWCPDQDGQCAGVDASH